MSGHLIILTLTVLVTYSFPLPIDLVSRRKRDSEVPKQVWRTYIFAFLYSLLIFLCVAALILWRYYKRKRRVNRTPQPQSSSPEIVVPTPETMSMISQKSSETSEVEDEECPAELLPKPINERMQYLKYDGKFEIDRKKNLRIDTSHVLGSGNFGVVHKGRLRKANGRDEKDQLEWMDVAVKRCTSTFDPDQKKMLELELKTMCTIKKHPNVLALVGATTLKISGMRTLIITEFVDGGELLKFLKNRRESFQSYLATDADGYLLPRGASRKQQLNDSLEVVTSFDLLSFAYQIANGMEHLAKVPLVHRDLALRNVLIRTNKIVRIGDFGLARRHADKKNYYRPSGENTPYMPIFHVAPECLQDLNEKFSEKSDVWSYGVCLYEIFSLGGEMYEEQTYHTLGPWLKKGNRLKIPENCHPDVENLIKLCWNVDPEVRPLFSMCKEHLEEHLKTSANQLLKEIRRKLKFESVYQQKMEEWLGTPEMVARNTN